MTKRSIRVNGITLAYEEQGAGRPVVLLHGFCGSSRYWERVVPLLADRFRVITPDLRGHGESEAPEGVCSMEAFAGDIVGLLDALDLEQAVVLGHSLGGYVTLALAEAYPERLSGFGLIHSTAFPDTEEGKKNRENGIRAIREQGIGAFVEGLVPKLFAPEHLISMTDAVERAKEIGRGTSPVGAAATQEGMRQRPDRNRVLEQTQVPVLLVAGSRDQVVPVEKTFSVSRETITQVRLDQAGHMSMYEAPEQLAAVIADFLA
jgi:pimeloyl-ACP methyl ester carboxylesterase